MRSFAKGPEPAVLTANQAQWTADYLAERAKQDANPAYVIDSQIKYKYREASIKTAVVNETHEKCAYCESKITHAYPGDIEHIIPSSKVRNEHFNWHNMTLACSNCNNRKSTYYNPADPLLNPYTDKPENHLMASGPLVLGKPLHRKGQLTEKRLKLNRGELIERRSERILSLTNLVERYMTEPEGELKTLLKAELIENTQTDAEFSFIAAAYVKAACGVEEGM